MISLARYLAYMTWKHTWHSLASYCIRVVSYYPTNQKGQNVIISLFFSFMKGAPLWRFLEGVCRGVWARVPLWDSSFPPLQPWTDPPPTPMPHHRDMSILAVDPETQEDCNGVPVPHDFSSGGDSVFRLSAIPYVSFWSVYIYLFLTSMDSCS